MQVYSGAALGFIVATPVLTASWIYYDRRLYRDKTRDLQTLLGITLSNSTGIGEPWDQNGDIMVLPLLLLGFVIILVFALQLWLNYIARTHAAGIYFHVKIYLMFTSPAICLTVFTNMVCGCVATSV